jgi:hypothetical protein
MMVLSRRGRVAGSAVLRWACTISSTLANTAPQQLGRRVEVRAGYYWAVSAEGLPFVRRHPRALRPAAHAWCRAVREPVDGCVAQGAARDC